LSDNEQDWIEKYRAALDSEQGQRSSASIVIAIIRRAWHALGLRISSKATSSSAQPPETEGPPTKKVSHRELSPVQGDRDTKAS